MSSSPSLTQPQIQAEVPRKLAPLLQPSRYKGAYGGRGGAKSHFFAEQIILRCYADPMRVVCIREVQKTIKDSVKQILVDKIAKFGLHDYFEIYETEIRGTNGALIIFRGMQHYNSESIKSLEGFDIAWVEEAQTLSATSLELLRPTIRKDGSELWFSWNPRHRTDPVDKFFRKHPPPDAVSVLINWRDNPWFPEVLRREMEHDWSIDAEAAEHIWEGGYGLQQGAILGRWVSAAEKDSRIRNDVTYDPDGPPVEISSDIGFRDTASWWFWQRQIGGFNVLAELRDNGLEAKDWIKLLTGYVEERGWKLGKIWLPHDARMKTFQSKHTTLMQFSDFFGLNKVGIVERSTVLDRINAARTVIAKCAFHADDCEEGLEGLRAWEYEWNPDLQVFLKEPKHNWASHPADAFSYGCEIMQTAPPPKFEETEHFTRPPTLGEMTAMHDRKYNSRGARL